MAGGETQHRTRPELARQRGGDEPRRRPAEQFDGAVPVVVVEAGEQPVEPVGDAEVAAVAAQPPPLEMAQPLHPTPAPHPPGAPPPPRRPGPAGVADSLARKAPGVPAPG